ncbi:MAG TPA: monofunctional biosynthetic peptidoglycan transglycosylase [Alphaproteobacteria bacterium]|nr:monofunctional biosynthetic peptidoglycan transglycosylase [Alphaproteobacteria bacterium]
MAKRKAKSGSSSGGLLGGVISALRWVVLTVLALVVLSILWVGSYRFIDPPTTYLIATTRASGTPVYRIPVPIEAISPTLWQTAIASEDQNFCTHSGFDTEAIDKAIEHNKRSKRIRGASTISQQAAKNVFLWPGRNIVRKGLEAYFTVLIETLWTKRRIMEVYLNVIEFGRGVFGAEAASEHFFHIPARSLTPRQAALLIAVLPNPHRMHAERPSNYVASRADVLVGRGYAMRRDGMDVCVRR